MVVVVVVQSITSGGQICGRSNLQFEVTDVYRPYLRLWIPRTTVVFKVLSVGRHTKLLDVI